MFEFYLKKFGWLVNFLFFIIWALILSNIAINIILGLIPSVNIETARSTQTEEIIERKITPRESYNIIGEKNIFSSEKAAPEIVATPEAEAVPTPPPEVDYNSPCIKSDVSVELVGTMVYSNPEKTTATVMEAGNTKIYKVGDNLMGEYPIYAIDRGKITFVKEWHLECVSVKFGNEGENTPAIKIDKPKKKEEAKTDKGKSEKKKNDIFNIDQAEWKTSMENVSTILMDASSIPHFEDGAIDGYTLIAMRPGSLYQSLGIEVGDTINKVNGKPVNSIDAALNLFQSLKDEKNFKITVTRDSQKKEITYQVK